MLGSKYETLVTCYVVNSTHFFFDMRHFSPVHAIADLLTVLIYLLCDFFFCVFGVEELP